MSVDGKSQFRKRLKKAIELLYTGRSRRAARFRYTLMCLDICTVVFFIVTTPLAGTTGILITDFVVGTFILADFLARLWIAPNKFRMLREPYTIADVLVILSLLLAPLVPYNLSFLRVLRAFRLLHSYQVLRDLRQETPFFRRNEEVIVSAVNLGVFVFIAAALVFALKFGDHPEIDNFIDALYFTVATLTTTGFGDIVLEGSLGRLLSICIMVAGVSLFLRLVQTIFRPPKLRHTCPECGLGRHEPDAVYCKRCGHVLRTSTEGTG